MHARRGAAVVGAFETAEIVPNLAAVAEACRRHGASMLVDAYHHLNAVPFDLDSLGLQDAFVTGGGYKYCQLGEGNAFLRVPPGLRLRPVLTGWFAAFDTLEETGDAGVAYGEAASAFAGATTIRRRTIGRPPCSRSSRIGLTPIVCGRRADGRPCAEVNSKRSTSTPGRARRADGAEPRGGFLAIRTPGARGLSTARERRARRRLRRKAPPRPGAVPADDQIRDAIGALGDALRAPRR